jgi:hypothetical protein
VTGRESLRTTVPARAAVVAVVLLAVLLPADGAGAVTSVRLSPVDQATDAPPVTPPVTPPAAPAVVGGVSGAVLGGGDIPLSTVMLPGSLVISVPLKQTPVPLSADGRLQAITVTDNRTGDPGWTVTALLTGVRRGGLGWSPHLLDSSAGTSIMLGPKDAPRAALDMRLGSVGLAPGPSLSQPEILASAAPGASLGTTRMDAALVPQGLTFQVSAATFTLTAI